MCLQVGTNWWCYLSAVLVTNNDCMETCVGDTISMMELLNFCRGVDLESLNGSGVLVLSSFVQNRSTYSSCICASFTLALSIQPSVSVLLL